MWDLIMRFYSRDNDYKMLKSLKYNSFDIYRWWHDDTRFLHIYISRGFVSRILNL